jgi:hypothetical protein
MEQFNTMLGRIVVSDGEIRVEQRPRYYIRRLIEVHPRWAALFFITLSFITYAFFEVRGGLSISSLISYGAFWLKLGAVILAGTAVIVGLSWIKGSLISPPADSVGVLFYDCTIHLHSITKVTVEKSGMTYVMDIQYRPSEITTDPTKSIRVSFLPKMGDRQNVISFFQEHGIPVEGL